MKDCFYAVESISIVRTTSEKIGAILLGSAVFLAGYLGEGRYEDEGIVAEIRSRTGNGIGALLPPNDEGWVRSIEISNETRIVARCMTGDMGQQFSVDVISGRLSGLENALLLTTDPADIGITPEARDLLPRC